MPASVERLAREWVAGAERATRAGDDRMAAELRAWAHGAAMALLCERPAAGYALLAELREADEQARSAEAGADASD